MPLICSRALLCVICSFLNSKLVVFSDQWQLILWDLRTNMYRTASYNADEFTAYSFRSPFWRIGLVLHSDNMMVWKGCILLLLHMLYVFKRRPLVGGTLKSEFLRWVTYMSVLRIFTYMKPIVWWNGTFQVVRDKQWSEIMMSKKALSAISIYGSYFFY